MLSILSRAGAQLRYKLGLSAQPGGQNSPLLPSNPEAIRLYSEGQQKLQIYDVVAARESLERSLAIEPTFPFSHYALAEAWSFIGYDQKAQQEAKKALDLSAGLSRESRLLIEARYWSTLANWDKAIDSLKTLWMLYPDSVDYGLELARAQVAAERGKDAMLTISSLEDCLGRSAMIHVLTLLRPTRR